ncbi:MAG: flavodoxin domain-containing protein [Desulforhopalus sp.]
MEIQSVSCVCFSPTGTSRTIVTTIAQGMQVEKIGMIDCTNRFQREGKSLAFNDEVVILATPVYYGRIPEEVVPFLKTIIANNTPVVLVVVYGNREYDDALLELHDISVAQGFIPVAGGAFVAEHSYSNPVRPIAHGRPDPVDIEKAKAFGFKIREKLAAIDSLNDIEVINFPGNIPYIEPKNLQLIKQVRATVSFTPETDPDKCTRCNLCVEIVSHESD